MVVGGDDNYNSSVTLKYRKVGDPVFKDGLPLYHVHPDSTLPYVISNQFSGSVLDLRPGTSYEIQLRATDPDGPVDQTFSLIGTTRSVPGDPPNPNIVNVGDAGSFQNALSGAQPGDVIVLANGYYQGPFSLYRQGSAASPLVIRGASEDGVVIDGGGCGDCNVLEVYGSWIHVENLTLQNAQRALKFQTPGAQANVVRRVHTKNSILGITMRENSQDFYIADNTLEGRLLWPLIYSSDGGARADDDGINVQGNGHVVAHNRISGFGDAMKTSQRGARAVDFYGNDVMWTYDNAVELDYAEGNARLLRNRFTNTSDTISAQPIAGGPAYIVRNVAVNIFGEQVKLHTSGGASPNGVFIYHNTFVSSDYALTSQTPTSVYHFAFENNIFFGPPSPGEDMTVDFYAYIEDGLFDYNGYWPDRWFAFNYRTGRLKVFGFAALQAAGLERNGTLLNPRTLANGMVGPSDYTVFYQPQDVGLASDSVALDRAVVLPNINDNFTGTAPDLGALERGCALPIYGPRPNGTDESNEPFGCTADVVPGTMTLLPYSGENQTVGTGSPFLPLQVQVLDFTSKPVAGVQVTFTAPSSGATGAFSGNRSATAVSDGSGIATSPQFVANGIAGTYSVIANATGAQAPASFKLTNVVRSAVAIVAPGTVVYSPGTQTVQVSATVSNAGSPVNTGSVQFSVNGRQIADIRLSNGAATATYQIPAGTPAGTLLTFTAQYSVLIVQSGPPASATGTTPVVKATPTINWTPPAPIAAGTALSSAQLNATANVPGTFQYTPSAGTVLSAGSAQKLSVSFTPSDTVNYNRATAGVSIDVGGAPQFAIGTATLVRDTSGNVSAQVTLTNTGAIAAAGVAVDSATLNQFRVSPAPVPAFTLGPGASTTFTLAFKAWVGPEGNPAALVLLIRSGGVSVSLARRLYLP